MKKKKIIFWLDPNQNEVSTAERTAQAIDNLITMRFYSDEYDCHVYRLRTIEEIVASLVSGSQIDLIIITPEMHMYRETKLTGLSGYDLYKEWENTDENLNTMYFHQWAYGFRMIQFFKAHPQFCISEVPILIYMDHEFHDDWQERITAGDGTAHDRVTEMILEAKESFNIAGIFQRPDLAIVTAIQDILEPKEEEPIEE